MGAERKFRFQCDLPDRMAKVLDRTKDKMGATSRREVVQEAINVLDIIAQNQGKEVAFQMTDSGAILITKPKTQSES